MALTLPDYTQLGTRQAEPANVSPRELQYLTGTDPQAVGAGFEGLGKGLESGANELFRAQKIESARIDTNRAEDAHTKLVGTSLDLNQGQDGFSNLHGADVVNQPVLTNYLQKFDAQSKQIESTLANDQQRQMFQRRANITRLQFQQDILRHIGNESEAYSKNVFEGGVSTEQQNAAVHWQNPADVALSMERVRKLVNDRADHLGLPKDQRDAMMVEAVSGIHREVINQALTSDNFEYASQYFDNVRGQMTPRDLEAVKTPMQLIGSQSTADSLMSKYGTGIAAFNEAGKISDPALKERVMDAITHRAEVMQRAQEMGEKNTRQTMSSKLESSDPTQPINKIFSAAEISQMARQPGLLETMESRQKERLNGTEVQTDPRVLDQYRTLMGVNPDAFMRADITKDYQHLSIHDRDYLEKAQKEIADPKNAPKYATEDQILRQAYYEIGADKLQAQQKDALQGQFFSAYKNEVQAFVQQNKRDPNADEMRQITKRLQLPFVQSHPEWYKSNSTAPLFQLDHSAGGSLQVPDADRQQIVDAYRQLKGRAPTDDEIMRAYVTRPQ